MSTTFQQTMLRSIGCTLWARRPIGLWAWKTILLSLGSFVKRGFSLLAMQLCGGWCACVCSWFGSPSRFSFAGLRSNALPRHSFSCVFSSRAGKQVSWIASRPVEPTKVSLHAALKNRRKCTAVYSVFFSDLFFLKVNTWLSSQAVQERSLKHYPWQNPVPVRKTCVLKPIKTDLGKCKLAQALFLFCSQIKHVSDGSLLWALSRRILSWNFPCVCT